MIIKGYIKDIQKRIENERVLDVGCLGSYEKSQLVRHNIYKSSASEIIGLDYNDEFLVKAYKAGHKNIYYCDITDKYDVMDIHLQFGSFKHVIATDVLEHIDAAGPFFANIKTLMDDDGFLYLTTPNVRSPYWFSMFIRNT